MRLINYLLLSALCITLTGCEKPALPAPLPPPPPPTEEAITEFMQAADRGDTAVILASLNKGMPVNYKDADNNSALLYASFNGHAEAMQALLEAGADVNHHGMKGVTPLIMACGPRPHGFPDAVRLLVANGAEINAVDDNEQFTALMYAAVEGLTDVVDILLEAGADPTMVDEDGDTAAVFARQSGATDIANKLQALIDAQNYKNQ
jgi:ankyrin repeat protein